MDAFTKWYEKHFAQIREDYFRFLRFRSISSEPAFKGEVDRCAEWVAEYLNASGLSAKVLTTIGHPIVFAEKKCSDADKPTLLIYGHYDVQPVDPLDLWESDPFEPTERGGKVFARGAVDDKGQIFYAMAALRALVEISNSLPIHVKFCIEGEEEMGSAALLHALPKIKETMKADYLLVVDFDSFDRATPGISLGARGMGTFDLTLTGSKGDLHSGIMGGIAYNPLRALSELLTKLYDSEGRVAVDGFYDDVVELSAEEKKAFPGPKDRAYYTREFGIKAFGGEKGRSPHEASALRPTLEINGIAGGYYGPGFKTVIPAKATAKISVRLVPNQEPEKIAKQIARFLERHCVPGMEVDLRYHGGTAPFRADPHSKLALAVASASEEVTGKKCQRMLGSGSIPVIGALAQSIGAAVVGMGYGLDTDQIHAPNEHFDFHRLKWGFLTIAKAIQKL